MNFNYNVIDKQLDVIVGFLILIVGLIVFFFYIARGDLPHLPLIAIFFSLLYIALRKRIKYELKINLSASIRKLNNIFFITVFILVVWLVFKSSYPYTFYYFVLLTLAGISISISIVTTDGKRDWIVMLKIILLITVIRASIYYAFPHIYGVDPLYHSRFCQHILYTYHIPGGGEFYAYSFYPIYHIILVQIKYISSLSIRDSMFILGILQLIVATTILYSIGRKVSDKRVGLLASFIFCGSAPIISYGITFIPNMFGLILFMVLFYLIVNGENNLSVIILFIVSSVSLVLTHPYPQVTLLFVMAVVYVMKEYGSIVLSKITKREISFIHVGTILLLGTIFIGHMALWAYNTTLRTVVTSFFGELEHSAEVVVAVKEAYSLSTQAVIYNSLNTNIILGFSLFGLLAWLSIRKRNEKRIVLAMLATSLLAFLFLIPLFNISIIPIPYRMWPFVYVPCSIVAAVGVMYFVGALKENKTKFSAVLIIIIIASTFFFSITSYRVSLDSGLYSEEIGARQALTPPELSGLNHLIQYSNGDFRVDGYCYKYVKYMGYDIIYKNMRSRGDKKMIFLRNYALKNPGIRCSWKLPSAEDIQGSRLDNENIVDFNDWSIIYGNGDVWVYRK